MVGYIMVFDGKGAFSPDGSVDMDKAQAEKHNKELEAKELAIWAEKPDRFAAYVGADAGIVRTWLGTKLGDVIHATEWKQFSRTMSTIRSIRVRGTNGAIYYGRYGSDWSQLVFLRKAKRHA